ncbi:hypothetical protein Q5H92_02410 [Hymenobacter sp. M29]|uniref:Uncharacterized protein n=1 Tax=Hymenobacter mellowenesis TaxID=3063995 RepID=A0ABT9A728_9BACT|nr:hypothetical protein [Hymenobacter sp. M29]MDO7845192.1 hypothetical protein [Hymenobacter sp. M29]
MMSRLLTGVLLVLLSGLVASCNMEFAPGADFKHANDDVFNAQTLAFEAETVSLSTERATANDSTRTYLDLLLLNPKRQPTEPDTLASRLKKLARLLVVDLKNPQDFDAVRIRIQTDHEYIVASTTNAQTFEFSLAELQ